MQVPVSEELLKAGLKRTGPAQQGLGGTDWGLQGMVDSLVDSWAQVLPFMRMVCTGTCRCRRMVWHDKNEPFMHLSCAGM